MGNSPKDIIKKGDDKSPVQANAEPSISKDPVQDSKLDDAAVKAESTTNVEQAKPLAPPPRPSLAVTNAPDYFSGSHGSNLSYETNPFESSFAVGGVNGAGQQTPGGTIKLPSVNALTSPAFGSGVTPFSWGGLRSGPLSPAMLSGPQKDDYFSDGHHLRGGFPTPNESGLRSGLTPGGGGSMFPEPSPNSQALFQQLASGGATPTTLDFHRTAMNAAAVQKRESAPPQHSNVTSQPQDLNGMDVKPPAPTGQFDQHDANDAANGLFLLANARNGPPQQGYAMAPQMPVHAHPQPLPMQQPTSTETSPHMANRAPNGSIDSGRGVSEASGGFSDDSEQRQQRPATRGKNPKRGSSSTTQTNGRRKAEDTPPKQPNKKAKGNNGSAMSMDMEPEPASEEEPDMNKDEYNANGKKMTDEEKRKNFLERNR
ncbi:bZIP transcription factor [Phlyctema vagabunda]|uniref:BZIP transcription factor n=1 Tax=Phlyctema vagabunda TaxID=108571 RepID=A0ABR4PMN7_9HELO